MKVLFLYVSTNMCRDGTLWFYDEGLASAASVLRERGHEPVLRVVDGRATEDQVAGWVDEQVVGEASPPLLVYLTSVHFSAYAHDIPNTFGQVMGLKERTGLPTMFAGLWATLNADALLDHPGIDMVGRGELDFALADVCDALEAGAAPHGIENIWTKSAEGKQKPALRPLVPDLDALPFPARDLLPVHQNANERDGILTMVGTRGCPMSCEFCTHIVVRKAYGDVSAGGYVRTKSVDYVIREIQAARERMPNLWAIYFHDDMFLLSKAWRDEFFDRYPREVGISFGCNMVIEQIQPELVAKLAKAGCSHVLVGVESGSEHMRTKVFNKPLSDEQITTALDLCRSHGIYVKFYALLGAPEESRKDLLESFKGFGRYCADMVQAQVWMAHETSDLLRLDQRAADIAKNQYDPKADRAAWRLKFYFHFFHRYVALYHLLGKERTARVRARIARAAVTASVLVPFAPELLMTCNWDGQRRWPRHFRWLGRLGLRALGGFGRRLQRDVLDLELRLAGDYMMPEGVDAPTEGWYEGARIDGRLREAREVAAGVAG